MATWVNRVAFTVSVVLPGSCLCAIGAPAPADQSKPATKLVEFAYGPALSELNGQVIEQSFPAQPNSGTAKGEAKPEVCWILKLDKPINVRESTGTDTNVGEKDVSRFQLLVDPSKSKELHKYASEKTRVVIKGYLTHGISGRHHTLVLLQVSMLRPE